MTHDLHTLQAWIRIVVLIAAVCSTSFPVLYSFSKWRSRPIGRLFMLQAASFALAIDMTSLFSYWHPDNILLLFWVDAIVLTVIAGSSVALTVLMWRMNHPSRKAPRK